MYFRLYTATNSAPIGLHKESYFALDHLTVLEQEKKSTPVKVEGEKSCSHHDMIASGRLNKSRGRQGKVPMYSVLNDLTLIFWTIYRMSNTVSINIHLSR